MQQPDHIHGVYLDRECGAKEDLRGWSAQINFALTQYTYWHPQRLYVVHNLLRNTLRGLHFQEPGKHKKLICITGEIFDVVVDLRPTVPLSDGSGFLHSHMQQKSFHLRPGQALTVPPGCANGYMTLTDNVSLAYLLEGEKNDDLGLRWNDPKLGIEWPADPAVISEQDREWELL